MEDNNIEDVEYEEIDDKTNKIRGKILYYMPGQVATILNQHFPNLKEPIAKSKITYYTKVFGYLLDDEANNKPARYTEQDIEKFKYIVELKESGMTLRQIQEYCEDVSFDENTGIQIKESNPLSIKSLATALLEEQSNQLQNFKEDLLKEIDNKLKQYLILQGKEFEKNVDQLKQDVVTTADEVITEKLEESSKNISANLDTLKSEIAEDTEKQLQDLKKSNEEKQLEITKTLEELLKTTSRIEKHKAEEQSKKENNIWNKLFKRNKSENEDK